MKAHVLKTLFALSISCLLLPALSEAQSTTKSILGSTPRTLHRVIKWENHTKDGNLLAFGFEGASYDANRLPVWVERFAVPSFGVVRATVRSVRYEAVKTLPVWWTDRIAETLPKGADVATVTEVRNARRTMTGEVRTTMLRRTAAGQLERAVEVDIDVAFEAQPSPQMRQNFVTQSELSDGTIYKVAVTDAGVYKLDYNFLKNTLGISNLDAIDPRRIRVLAGDAGILPERNNISRTDDLAECAAYISGESDGKFDTGDYLLFYARGASVWNFASDAKEFNYTTNPYADRNYYFIKIDDSQTGKRAASRASLATTIQTTNSGDVFAHYEKDEVNIMRRAGDGGNGLGTGRDFWEKDYFKYNNSRAYSFVFPNLVATEPVRVTSRVAAHCYVDGASFTVQANGVTLATHNIPRSITNISAESQYAYDSRLSPSYTPAIGGGTINVQLTFNRPDYSAIGWLDYIELQGRAALNCSGVSAAQVAFRDSRTVGAGNSTTFQLSNLAGATLWDVTDPFNVQAQGTDASGNSFGVETSILREFVAFNPANLPAPTAAGRVSSQNLHALAVPDMVILTHSAFRQQAEQLAAHRRTQSALEVAVVDVNEVYNEFASGRKDITAIRDFARMLYTRDAKFHYLLFMGDASFDYRGRYGDNDFIPTYETPASLDDVTAYATDDFFALLDPSEGASPAYGGLDIAVGRLPVNNSAEASDAVGKIIHYDTSPDMLGEWVNRLTFVADNPDIYTGSFDNEHEQYADATAVRNNQRYVRYNQDKIYLDSYELISGAAGGRFPDANAAINQAMFKGSLVMNYVGHGGPEGWAQERVVQYQDFKAWNNSTAQPLIITASCSVSRYDDPSERSMGEWTMLNPSGGAIALFSTSRPVYGGVNHALVESVFDSLFTQTGANLRSFPIGEILRLGKNESATSDNGNKFSLLGDPAMRLQMPEYRIRTTKYNGATLSTDTLRALQTATIEGEIVDGNNTLNPNFNGTLFLTLFDKPVTILTRGNDGVPQVPFSLQKNILFKGSARINAGKFTLTVQMPQDINYSFGNGKASYYAKADGQTVDAAGSDTHFVIGGTVKGGLADNAPPTVLPFMNDYAFVSGGVTNDKPLLLVKLSDDTGINTSSSSIGHDITAVIDGNTEKLKVLNDFYQPDPTNRRAGIVKFPLDKLSDGKHTATVKAWDIVGKSTTNQIDFVVTNSSAITLSHVLNYPNPFTTATKFQFEHNLAGQAMHIQIQVFSIAGSLLKTITADRATDTFRVDDIAWDGNDDYGNRLANGVYVYRLAVQATDTNGNLKTLNSDFEKLVIVH